MHIPSFLVGWLPLVARIIGLMTLAAGLASCSAIKLGYNQIDTVGYWWLDSYLDFSDDQTTRVRQDLGRLQQWHRAEELPQFNAMLRGMEQLAPGEITPAQACAFIPQVRERLGALSERAEPAVVTLAMSLGPEQLTHLQRKYEKVNADYRKDWIELAEPELRDKRLRQFVERSEMIYGRLDEPQRLLVRAQMEQSIFDPRRLLAERQRRQLDALETLRKLAGQPVSIADARVVVRGLLERAQQSPEQSFRRYQNALFEETCRSFSALHNSTNAAQREAAARRLRAYQRDLRDLSAQQ